MPIFIKQGVIGCVNELMELGKTTFIETYADQNTEKDMRQYVKSNFNKTKITEELNTSSSIFFLAYINKTPAGYMKINFGNAQTVPSNENGLQIERIYVLKKYQGRKIGSTLMKKAFDLGKELSRAYIWVDVWEQNPKAIQFYEKKVSPNLVHISLNLAALGRKTYL